MHNMHLVNMQNVGWGTTVLGAHSVGLGFIKGLFKVYWAGLGVI